MMKFKIPNEKTSLTEAELRAFVRTCLRAVTRGLFRSHESGDLKFLDNETVKRVTLREVTNCARANNFKPKDTLFVHTVFREFFDLLVTKKQKIVFQRQYRVQSSDWAEHSWN